MLPFLRRASRKLAFVLGTLALTAILPGVPRSAAAVPFTGGNILVCTGDKVYELTRTGEVVRKIVIPATSPYPSGATDLVVDRNGKLHVINRVRYPETLDTYDPVTQAWKVRPMPGAELANTINSLTTLDQYLYVPIQLYGSVWPRHHVVRIDITDDSPERFPQINLLSDVSIGLDGLLHVLISDPSYSNQLLEADEPASMTAVGSFYTFAPAIYNHIAANAQGEIFGTRWSTLSHLAADGKLLKSVTVNLSGWLTDVEVSKDGAVIAGTYNSNMYFQNPAPPGTIFLTNESLEAPVALTVPDRAALYVAFVPCQDGDSDCDDVTDTQEAALGTDPANRDSDGDGLVDGEEVNFHHSDPLRTETDGDGLSDNFEVRVAHTDPGKADTDGDGLSDPDEINTFHTDPLNADTDGDGLDDAEEVAAHTDPFKSDTDGDGLSDAREVHDLHTDPLRADTDGDQLSDLAEVLAGTSPLLADTDSDGLSDYEEIRIWGTNPLSRSIPYLLNGTITASSGGIAQVTPITELLFLSADRSYVIGIPGDGTGEPGVPERGVWFRSQGGLLFYQQNLFAYLGALADAVEPQLGPVTIVLRANNRSALVNERSGILSVRGTASINFLRGPNASTVGLLISDRVSGPFSEIPMPEPTSAGNDPAASFAPPVGTAAPAGVPVASSAWLVKGTVATRTGRTTETRAISGSLLLDSDQTFALDLGEVETPIRGMWFQDRKSMLLYQQNLLDQTIALERAMSARTGEPVRADLLQVRDTAVSDIRTGVLLLTLEHRYGATLVRSGQVIAVTSTWKLTATPAP